jgi:hypothetical protein
MKIRSAIKRFPTITPIIRGLRTQRCPSPPSQQEQTHYPSRILVISQRGLKQTPPERTLDTSRYKLVLVTHVLSICLSTRELINPLRLLKLRKEEVLLKPQKLMSTDESFKMTFYQSWFETREDALLKTQMGNLSLSSSKTE